MVSPRENLAELEAILARARLGAKATAEAMARYIAERTANDTLMRNTHGVGEYWKAAPGAPPASASGTLARSMYWTRGQGGGTRASAFAGSKDRRAKMMEHGCEPVRPTTGKVMHWTDSKGSWYHSVLPADESGMPEHPFLGPTTDEAIDDGELRRVAIEAFREYDP